jgi:hypothetical protein
MPEEEKKESLNLLDVSSAFEIKDETPPVIYYFSIDEIVKGQIEVTLRVGRVEEEIGSGIKAYKWELKRNGVKIGEVPKTPEDPKLPLENLYQTFSLTEPAEKGETFTGIFTAWNVSDYEATETASTIVKGIDSLNFLDSTGTIRVSDGAPPYIEIHSLAGARMNSTRITVEATIYDIDEFGYRTDTLKQIRLVLNVTGQPEQGITETVPPEKAWGYDRAEWTFAVEPLKTSDVVTITIYAVDVGGEEGTESRAERVPGLFTLNLLDSEGAFKSIQDTITPVITLPNVVQDLQGTLADRGADKIGLQAWLSDEADGHSGLLRWARFSLYIAGFEYYEQIKEWMDIFKESDFFRTDLWQISLLTGGEKSVLEGGEEIYWRIVVEDTSKNRTVQEGIHSIYLPPPPPPPPPDILEYWHIIQPFAGEEIVRIEFKLRQEAEVTIFLGIDEPPSEIATERQAAGVHIISISTALLEMGQTVFANLAINGVLQVERSKIVLSLPVRPFVRGYGWAFSFGFGE